MLWDRFRTDVGDKLSVEVGMEDRTLQVGPIDYRLYVGTGDGSCTARGVVIAAEPEP